MHKILVFVLILFIFCSFAVAGELKRAEIDVYGYCDSWHSFPTGSWTNTTGQTIHIKIIQAGFSSAQSLIGEYAVWFFTPTRGIYSYGVENYQQPTGSVRDTFTMNPDYVSVAPNEVLTAMANCGPVNINGLNGNPVQGGNYAAVVMFYYSIGD